MAKDNGGSKQSGRDTRIARGHLRLVAEGETAEDSVAADSVAVPDVGIPDVGMPDVGMPDDGIPDDWVSDAWVEGLAEARIVGDVIHVSHELGDSDDYLISFGLDTGEELSLVVFVDHNMNSAVTDAFLLPMSNAKVIARMRVEFSTDQGGRMAVIDPALARAAIDRAIENADLMIPPPTSDNWPMSRPIVEWVLGLLPVGGRAPEPQEWPEPALTALVAGFFASDFGRGLDGRRERKALEEIVWLNAPDPMRWSPSVVEKILLFDLPHEPGTSEDFVSVVPQVMKAFIGLCHQQRGISAVSTAKTVAKVDALAGQFADLMGVDSRPDRARADFGASFDWHDLDPDDRTRLELELRVGGPEALAALDDAPLPDEPFDVSGIEPDILPLVEQVCRRCDEVAEAFYDVEHRTAMRRVLAITAQRDPGIFRRKMTVDRTAATIGWVVGRANDTLNGQFATSTLADYLAWFPIKSGVSKRAESFLKALDVTYQGHDIIALENPGLLTAQMRAEVLRRRDRLRPGDAAQE